MSLPDVFKSTLFWRLLISICAANLLVLILGTWLAQGFIALSQNQRTAPARTPLEVEQHVHAETEAHRHIELNPSSRDVTEAVHVDGIGQPPRQFVADARSHGRMSRRTKENISFATEAFLFFAFIVIIGWHTARSVSRPIEAMREAASRMAKGDLSARIPAPWSSHRDEFGVLSRDFNVMAERVEALVSHERAILQDLSHELRSPLARLLASLHLVRRQPETDAGLKHLSAAEHEVIRIDRITSEMLALSRLEADLPGMEREWVDMVSLVQARLAAASQEAQEKSIRARLAHTSSPRVFGSEILLERVIDNLLSNAIKYSGTDETIEITISEAAHGVELRIRDHGPGIREEDMGSLFRPFFRGANAHLAEGNGLGLSVVRRIMRIHDGDVLLRNASPHGLEVTLIFSGFTAVSSF